MATTVQLIITRALRLLSEINSGAAPTASESADALTTLNAMLDSWRNDRLMCYALREEAIPLIQGNITRTIGPTGDLVTTRPVKIESARVDVGLISYPVKVIQEQEYSMIGIKTQQQSWPMRMWYQCSFPNGTIYLWPVPAQSCTLYVTTWTTVLSFAALTDAVSLPPGWEQALATNLAIQMASEYATQPSAMVMKMAADSLKLIKRVNNKPVRMYFDNSLLTGATYYTNGNPI